MAIKSRFSSDELRQRLLNTINTINLQIEDGFTYGDPKITIQLNSTLTENLTENISNNRTLNLTWNENYVKE